MRAADISFASFSEVLGGRAEKEFIVPHHSVLSV